MGKILNAEDGEHIVQEYKFVPLEVDSNPSDTSSTPSPSTSKVVEENIVNPQPIMVDNSKQTELIEQLLKKSDEFASAIVRLESQLEKQAEECNNKIGEIKESSYKAGYNEGYNTAKKELEDQIKEQLSRLVEGVHKIEEVYKEFQTKAENIEKELVGVAIDIAEEVISKELSKHSKEIALKLTQELLEDIKEATKIEIKLNPLDYEYVKDKINLEKVKLTPDNAVSKGGVVILSDAGNIEAEIYERFKNVKNHLLKG